jgi:putative transposase
MAFRISMDVKGCCLDNVFVERLWRRMKYEHVHHHAHKSVSDAKQQPASYFVFYDTRHPYSSLDGHTPDMTYFASQPIALAA